VDAGLDSRVELKQTEAAIPATRERVEQLEETIALTRHQLAALAGEGPDRGLAIARPAASGLQAIALPSRIPAELLGRRPDLVAQRWRVAAAAHGIDAAKARFYPNVNLVALVGLQSLGASGFLSAASRTVAAGPALSLPIFDGGRLRSELAGSRAEYDAAVERYNQVLADALRDVADQLASFQSVQAQRTQERQALQSTAEASALAVERYREGVGSYLQVLAAEAPLLAQRSLDARLHARELVVSIHLMRALGGGFDAGAASPGESRHER
jgi:NodT family efflux transporter outer membrane factor (OMF) lipoprotein